jgi:transcription antitermination factor NusG
MLKKKQAKMHTTNWFVVYTKPNSEKKVAERLALKCVDVYLPLVTTLRQWSDRKKKVTLPLIPSVVFVACEPNQLNNCYTVPGVKGVLKYLSKPAIVQEYEIENLKILLNGWDDAEASVQNERLQIGDPVEVQRGPFAGMLATSIEINGKHRVVVGIDSLGAHFTVNVPRSFVRKIKREVA